MRYSAVVGFAAAAMAAPSVVERAPDGCAATYNGNFEITVFKAPTKRDLTARAGCTGSNLVLTLENGVLKDAKSRTGYIASNYQFQFDGPPQAGARQTSGFSVCANGTLALDSSTTWYQCRSGDFNNLYDRSWAPQCSPVEIVAMGCGTGSGSVSQTGDGQVQGPTKVSQISDGQVQGPTKVPTNAPITQIGDGQIQAPTGNPITQIGDGQIQVPTSIAKPPPATQIGDGQVQAPTSAPTAASTSAAAATQIGDGQVQAPTSAPAAPTGAVVTQIGDGQVQAPTSVGTISAVPSPSVSMLPPSAGNSVVPGTTLALFVAAFGAVLYL